MDLHFLHLAMGLPAAACLFFISWLNFQDNISGKYSPIITIGTGIAGAISVLHNVVALYYPELMSILWGSSRATLVLMFLLVATCFDSFTCSYRRVFTVLSAPFIISAISIAGAGFATFTWSNLEFDILNVHVYRTFDFILMISWCVTACLLQRKAHVLFPPHTYWLFMIQGVLVHAFMAFGSEHNTDMAFMLAHGLNISEFYSFILIYLIYKNQIDNFPRINTPKYLNHKKHRNV